MDPVISGLTEDWMERVMEQSDNEVKEEIDWPTLPLHRSVRKLVWVLSSTLGVNSKGVPGSACRLLEKYLSRHMKRFSGQTPDREQWERYKDTMSTRLCLLLVTCILLAAKMSCVVTNMSVTMVRQVLLKEGYSHTKDEIKAAEYEVFRTLDFSLPIWSTVEIAEFFVVKELGLTGSQIVESVGLTMDLAEFHRNEIALAIQDSNPSTAESSSRQPSIRNVHLCAGVVVASLRQFGASTSPRVSRLAQVTRTTTSHLIAIADGISEHLLISPPKHRPNILKRRRYT